MIDLSSLQFATIDNMKAIWNDDGAQALFRAVIDLKLRAWRNVYPEHVLPVETGDFFGRHHVVLFDGVPIAAYKTVELLNCEKHCAGFPIFDSMRSSHADAQLRIIQKLTSNIIREGKSVAYTYSFGICPNISKGLKSIAREASLAHAVGSFRECEIDVGFAQGVCKFKMPAFFKTLGYQSIVDESGEHLGSYTQKSINGERVEPLVLMDQKFSDYGISCFEKYHKAWVKRVRLGEFKSARSYSELRVAA